MIEALYIHVPFCVKRCAYCDFHTTACSDDAVMNAYVDALSLQLRRASRAGLLGGVRTIYIGGGTPTHLGARRLGSLVYLISLSINLENVVEFTVECNPESLNAQMVKDLFALGVNRFSIGAQSFDDAVLAAYGRVHDAAAIDAAIACVAERTDNYSLDLICGGSGQDMDSWEASVNRALARGAKHVSVYPLTVEDGALLAARIEDGEVDEPSEDTQADMMQRAAELLCGAGMQRYEVASYAYPGYESVHNSVYWSAVEYLGLGSGASSMLSADSMRACVDAGLFTVALEQDELSKAHRCRVSAAADSRAFSESGGRPQADVELMSSTEAIVEDLMLACRKSEGLALEQIEEAAGQVKGLCKTLEDLVEKGLLEQSGPRLVPTQRGWLMGNILYGAIWDLASQGQ